MNVPELVAMAEQWLSIVEYARTFALSDMTVRRRIKNGKIKAVLKDGKYFIPVHGAASAPAPSPAPVERPVQMAPAHRPPVARPVQQYPTNMDIHRASAPRMPEPRPVAPTHYEPVQAASHPGQLYTLPEAVTKNLVSYEHTVVMTQQLLNFCHNALKKQELLEKQIEQRYASRVQALEHAVQARDAEIVNLRQQIEDLQLLVKVFERKQGFES